MAPLIALILFAATATANGDNLASECVADSDSVCRLEETMKVELLQDRYSIGGSPLAVPSNKAPETAKANASTAAVKVTRAKANATTAAVEVVLAANASHASLDASKRSGNLAAVNASVNASAQPFPDIGGIIGGVTDAISGGGGIGDIVNSVTGGAAEALLTPIENAVNSSLEQINSQVIALADTIATERNQLVASADASWSAFAAQLNATLEDAMAQFSMVPFSTITSTLDSVGASGVLPPEVTDALAQISSVADILSNATLLAQQVVSMENLGYGEAAELMATLNNTLYDGLALAQTGTEMLDQGFVAAAANAMTSIQSIPGMSILPEAVMDTVQAVFDSASVTVHTIATQTSATVASLVTGVEQAAVSALGTLPQEEQSSASGFAPLFAATLAMGAVACH